ncbi:MAG: tryptophan--tRNA ligase, partial [Oscillospiraceae bacterium]
MEQAMGRKKIVLSGIQSTGIFTLGNYLGAVRNWGNMQTEFDCAYFIANLHALTVRQDPKVLKYNTISAYAQLLACGVNPKKSIAFTQSDVHAHAQLTWILNCYTQFGELGRMTQFKDKSLK